ncbi:MAG TPA: penicillin-binding protein 2 [Candidatus Limnocylindria bacterium]|jgi:cell division protein FtsI/penicillin-binding protein 2|nr:penicillin-binding protein 2 [Candidatus Limnocylindria bacterium]
MLARTDSRARALFLLLVAAVVAGGIGTRLAWWQVVERDRLAGMALAQLDQTESIPAARGDIIDATGELLATTVELQSIFATPPSVDDPASTAALLAPLLGWDVHDLQDTLASNDAWVWLKRRVDLHTSDQVRALHLPGIGLLPETKRVYPVQGVAPDTTLASQVLGFVNVDGIGQYGIESSDNALLAGLPGSVTALHDVAGRQIADSVFQLKAPVDGADLKLTIDAGLQHLLESAMWETYRRNYAKGVTGVVMDVNTGAVLALATFPSYDANGYAKLDPALFTNPAVSRQYEPGSVMKAFTIAAALDAGAITTREKFRDDNNLRLAGVRIQNADRYWYPNGHGRITAGDVLKLSNNVGAAKIGLTLGGQGLYQALRRFGFGEPTGIEIAGEAPGTVWNPDGPNGSGQLTTAQNSFGQGLSVTAMQLVAGYAAIGNGGRLVTPHVVAGWTTPDGTYHPTEQTEPERVMRQETANTVLHLLTDAVDFGIAQPASIPGYSVAGKTGTAQIAGPITERVRTGTDARGKAIFKKVTHYGYIRNWIDSSFISLLPASKPKIATLILIHRPAVWGLYQMAQRPDDLFRSLAPDILSYLAIPPDRKQPPDGQVARR